MGVQPRTRAPELDGYLAPGERVVTVVHQHWVSLWAKILAVVGATLLAFTIDINASASPAGRGAADVGWFVWLVAVLWLVWGILNWRHDWFVATDKRLLRFFGFIRRKVAMMPMRKVTDMTFERSPLGRLIGYGTFILESAGQEQALGRVDFIPDADEHYRRIVAVLFGGADTTPAGPGGPADLDDEGPWPPGPPGPPGGGGYGGGGYGGPGEGSDAPHLLPEHDRRRQVAPARPYEGEHVRHTHGQPAIPAEPDLDDRAVEDLIDYGYTPRAEHLYRSEDLVREAHTDEIPVVRVRRMPPRGSW